MTAPVVSPGGASPPRAVDGRGPGRREEAAQTDGTFASLLALLAPAQPPAADGAAPAMGEPVGPVTGGGAIGLLEALTGQPQAGLPAQAAVGVQSVLTAGEALPQAGGAAPMEIPVGLAALDQGEPAPLTADLANPAAAAAPGGHGGEAAADLPHAAPTVPLAEGAVGTVEAMTRAAQPPAHTPGGPAAPEADGPAQPADGAGSVQAPAAEALLQPGAEPAGRDGAGSAEGEADQAPGFLAQGTERQAAPEGAAAPGQAADAAAGPSGDPAPAAEAVQARGLERLTAGRLQVQQVVEELSRALPELQDGQYRLTLRLHPEHLGEVRLELHLSGREVHAAVEVANLEARQALESRGDQLRQNLSDAGYNLTGFEVATGEGRQPRREQEDEPAGWAQPQVRGVRPAESPAAAIQRVRSTGVRGGRLDTMA
ncbi:flagellar hook-length control protein FliK [Symbiobacterium terraclitae]|uniref:flagellar hook-length control protein FliK n=1 Tax=Symbiobacterium terraclitae TaxID=557451 RepID=UPI0035B54B8D